MPPHRPRRPDPSPLDRIRRRTQKRLALRSRLLSGHGTPEALDDAGQRMLDHELAIAAELQANLLPRRIPRIPGFELGAFYRPSREIGGDYYDLIPLDREHWGIAIADVSGKGIPGSIVMTETRALLKSEAVRTRSPAEALRRVNRVLHQDIKRGMFVTMLYLVLDVPARAITVTSAGHLPLLLWRAGTKTLHQVHPNALALGIDEGALFEKSLREQRVALQVGDRFLVYTDGVVEAMDKEQRPYGTARFHALVRRHAAEPSGDLLRRIADSVLAYERGSDQHDDISLLTGRVLEEDPEATAL